MPLRFTGILLPNFNKSVQRETMTMVLQHHMHEFVYFGLMYRYTLHNDVSVNDGDPIIL